MLQDEAGLDIEMDSNRTWRECDKCGKKLASYKTLWQHKKTCKNSWSVGKIETAGNNATGNVEESNHQLPKDSQFSTFIDNIINKNPESEDATIQPLKSSSMNLAAKNITLLATPLVQKEPVEEIFSGREIAKNLIKNPPQSEESSEDESIVERPLEKRKKLMSTDDTPLLIKDVHIESKDVILKQQNENSDDEEGDRNETDENEEVSDDGLDITDGRGGGKSTNEDESDRDNIEHISKHGLKTRLYREVNNMKVYELNLHADEALTNIDLLKYVDVLKVPKFRGVFMRDELPERPNPVECGIVNLSAHEQLGTHWVCYAKIYNTRIYFDSFARKIPLEIQKYLKTEGEFRNNIPTIERNTDTVQRVDTKVCGHLCLFVITSIMREHLSFQHVMNELNYGYSQYYW